MTGTLTKYDVKQIFRSLDKIQELCNYMRHHHHDAPYETVYGAVGAEYFIRMILVEALASDIQIEAPEPAEVTP